MKSDFFDLDRRANIAMQIWMGIFSEYIYKSSYRLIEEMAKAILIVLIIIDVVIRL